MMAESEHQPRCPLSAVDRRLGDVHRQWHEAEREYFDPDSFRVAIQTVIQTLRTVTFILQSNKRLFSNFDAWYESWQVKLRADSLMRWMVDARNKIEKRGDLEVHSYVRAEVLASYYDDEGPRVEVPTELFHGTAELFASIPTEALKNHILKDGFLRIQRRWVENTLPDHELLDAVGIAYGRIAELVADAHRELGLAPPSTMNGDIDQTQGFDSRRGRLPCMVGHSESRTVNVWLATGKVMDIERQAVDYNGATAESVARKYELDPKEMYPTTENPEVTLTGLFAAAKKMFAVDGYHDTIAFLLAGTRPVSMMSLRLEEHGEKYLIMRMLADEVTKLGADGVIIISELWSASYDPSAPYRRAADAADRKEYLSATLVTKAGNPVQLLALIERTGDTVALGETNTLRDHAHIAFAPVYAAWGRKIPEAWRQTATLHARDGG